MLPMLLHVLGGALLGRVAWGMLSHWYDCVYHVFFLDVPGGALLGRVAWVMSAHWYDCVYHVFSPLCHRGYNVMYCCPVVMCVCLSLTGYDNPLPRIVPKLSPFTVGVVP